MCVRRLLISGSKVQVLDGPPIVSATSEASGVADAVFATTWVIELVYRDLIPKPLPVGRRSPLVAPILMTLRPQTQTLPTAQRAISPRPQNAQRLRRL